MSPISTKKHGDVLIVTSNNPPVNALGHAVREGLVAAIEEADARRGGEGGGDHLPGPDLLRRRRHHRVRQADAAADAAEVVDIIENCTKPVVAAIHGTAFGGGLEVALASHYRVAVPSAKLGVPEVKLGLLPGAGGTQRLPRVAGVAEGAGNGRDRQSDRRARRRYEIGLVDRLIEGDLEQHAVAFAEEVRDIRPIPKSSERDDKLGRSARQSRRSSTSSARPMRASSGASTRPKPTSRRSRRRSPSPMPKACMDERRLFMELMTGTQARAQQYFFFAERKAAKIDGLPEGTEPREISRVGVIGAGTMGGGISMNFLSRRHPGDDRRDGAGGARPRHRRDAQELRGDRGQGPDDRRRRSKARWAC